MKFLTNLTPQMSLLITAGAIVGLGIIVQANLIDSAFADKALAFLLGGGAGAALVGGQVKGGGV
jgi:hypothetical protein